MSEIDCQEVLEMVWSFLDGEIEDTRYLEIRTHVESCSQCGPRYEFQRQVLILIERKCKEGPVPESLKQRLFRLLEE